ncbi:uncharacterized protein DUF4407 [Flavobacterium aquicola]|uniref:Uncharacterized protein DUF4407 n=2 Tax=Flavobacterium aquicola TaxID=1682742 RepID=A0A3E0EDX1_9FLAO|nr:uncharacterized protein DUF4407 [Flavobacterium aquicola]
MCDNQKFGVKFAVSINQNHSIMLKQFFILCSGADKPLLDGCSEGEQTKYAGIGATVFFTAVMAFIASAYALFTVFDSVYPALLFGLVWSLLIFNLDRFIVSTIRKRNSFSSEFLQATPRIILAIIIAIVISKPLEIKIFEKEINTVLLKEKNAMALNNKKEVANYFKSDLDKNKADIKNLKAEISNKEKEVNTLYQTYIQEAEGTAGTKKLGKGPVFKEKIAKHDLSKKELDTIRKNNLAKIAILEKGTKTLQTDLDKKVTETQPIIDGFDGLMARINALNKLPWLPSFFIMLLFLAIETSPIIAKLLSPKGEYDFKLEDLETALKATLDQNKHQRELLIKTNASMHYKVYADIADDKRLYDLQRKNAEELLELQSNGFLERQKQTM